MTLQSVVATECGQFAQLTVLESFPVPLPTTNPYLIMLAQQLHAVPAVTVRNFSWRAALFGRYDVFHVHWPETLFGGQRTPKTLAKQMVVAVILLRLSAQHIPIVRTVHNVWRPDGLSRIEYRLLDMFDRRTVMRIRLNDQTPVPMGAASATIKHGHYRTWFAAHRNYPPIEGQIGYTGLVRRYKGVESLVTSFASAASTRTDLSLRIGGKPSTRQLEDVVRTLAGDDPRVRLDLHFLSDAELVEIVTSSELVVLPYHFMHNSGGLLAALSLNRPVLVPNCEVNAAIAAEVGPGWIYFFDGEVDAVTLLRTLDAVRRDERSEHPNLSDRNWDQAGIDHVAAFREAVRLSRRNRRKSRAHAN